MPNKDIEKRRKCDRAYRKRNKSKINKERRERYATDSEFRERLLESNRITRKSLPWMTHLDAAKTRCTNLNQACYKYYGGKGIRMLLSELEIEILYKRDHADLMKKPSLDRINPNGDYIFGNCRFIEHSENIRKMAIRRWSLRKE